MREKISPQKGLDEAQALCNNKVGICGQGSDYTQCVHGTHLFGLVIVNLLRRI
jgi:hypothetical protein